MLETFPFFLSLLCSCLRSHRHLDVVVVQEANAWKVGALTVKICSLRCCFSHIPVATLPPIRGTKRKPSVVYQLLPTFPSAHQVTLGWCRLSIRRLSDDYQMSIRSRSIAKSYSAKYLRLRRTATSCRHSVAPSIPSHIRPLLHAFCLLIAFCVS